MAGAIAIGVLAVVAFWNWFGAMREVNMPERERQQLEERYLLPKDPPTPDPSLVMIPCDDNNCGKQP